MITLLRALLVEKGLSILVIKKGFLIFQIRNKFFEKCLQTTDKEHGSRIKLAECSHNKTNPIHQQHFMLRHSRDISIYGKSDCLEGSKHLQFSFSRCHYNQGNQYFRFDVKNLHIFWGRKRNNLCVDASVDETVFINTCDKESHSQQWIWGFSRVSSLLNWTNNGAPILDETEKKDLLNDQDEFIVDIQSEGDDNEFCAE